MVSHRQHYELLTLTNGYTKVFFVPITEWQQNVKVKNNTNIGEGGKHNIKNEHDIQ